MNYQIGEWRMQKFGNETAVPKNSVLSIAAGRKMLKNNIFSFTIKWRILISN